MVQCVVEVLAETSRCIEEPQFCGNVRAIDKQLGVK